MGKPILLKEILQRQEFNEQRSLQTTSHRSSLAVNCINSYGPADKFLTTFNPGNQFRYCQEVDRCYTGKAPAIKVLTEAYGEQVAESWVMIQLNDLSEFAGCKEKMSIHQIEQVAKVILMEFGYLKVTELMHFFVLFKSGKFGKFYGAVDGLVITEALQEFTHLRAERLWRIARERERAERALRNSEDTITYEEWQELKWLFNMGYERQSK